MASRARRSQAESLSCARSWYGTDYGGGVMVAKPNVLVERLLTVGEAASLLGTSERFPRRLIAERRIRFVRVGRHVRIPESALDEFIAAGMVEPVVRRRRVA
jgi:excisionase family DNA binding protein